MFTRMDQSTQAEWQHISEQHMPYIFDMPKRIMSMLEQLQELSLGFGTDQLHHALQTATMARRAGADDEMVLLSLVHDIGKVINVPNHGQIAAEIIKPYISEDAYQGKPNPHAWMSPQNALIYVENIRKALVKIDPANAATYDANAQAYSQQIQALDAKLKQAIAVIPPDKRYIVSCEGAFSYIARDYGLKEVYIWSVNAEQQATTKQIEKVIEVVKANKIPTVFCESTVSDKAMQQVVKETGAKYGGVFYVDSLSPPDGLTPTYLKLLEYNINTLIKGLQ